MPSILNYARKAVTAARDYNTLDPFPARETLGSYNRQHLSGDVRAGVNVALLAFPQGMAYALIAGLPSNTASMARQLPR